MSFEEIIYLMEIADNYSELYDAAENIIDEDLRSNVISAIGICEDDGDDIETACSIVTSDWLDTKKYDLNESKKFDTTKERNALQDYIDDINEVSNDKDLINIIDDMEKNKSIDKDLVTAVRQLFKNNRFTALNQKADTIIKFIKENSDEKVETEPEDDIKEEPEQLTEAVDEELEDVEDIDKDTKDNAEKENQDIEDIKEKGIELTTLDTLKKRIGQQFDVGEFNSLIQTTFNQYNQVFLMTSDLYNMNLDQTQTIDVDDDDKVYTISYDIIDMDSGLIELKNVEEKEV